MQDGSVTFYPVRPPPLELWQIVLGVILFLVLDCRHHLEIAKSSGEESRVL
jgi:hypothetical protein